MPLYEYRCERCGKVFEVLQKFSDAPLETHADCGGQVERLISAPAFQFKGTGWYVTDYSRSGSSSSPSKDSESKSETKTESKSESGSQSNSETKSVSKSDSKPAPAKSE
jgi:putative FmdB family regulatory protein